MPWQFPGRVHEDPGPLRAFGVTSLDAARINACDPAVSVAQRRFLGADLARKRAGKPTKTGMSEKQLAEYAATPEKGLPRRKRTR